MKKILLYPLIRPIIKVFFKILYQPTYIGIEYLPRDDAFILAGNHTSYLDCLLLMSSTKRVIHFLAKEELTKGFKGILFKHMGLIPVNRKIHDKAALSTGIEILKDNEVVGIFPEGTINRSREIIMPFKIGAVKMSKEAKASIVPFVIKGKYKLFRKSITIQFFKPFKALEELSLENEKLMNKIKLELEKEEAR